MKHVLRFLFVSFCLFASMDPLLSGALAEERWVGFSLAPTAPPTGADSVKACKSSLTRAFVIDTKDDNSTPREIALRLPSGIGAVASRDLAGWTLGGQPILTVGIFQGDRKDCEGTTDPYPFNYESCICPIDGNSDCVCPTMNVDWNNAPTATPTPKKYNLHQVNADRDHHYFQGEHPITERQHLFRINHDGSDLKLMAGAGGHAAAASPQLKDVYFIENHPVDSASPSQTGESCIAVREGTAAEGTRQNFRSYCGNEKTVYAKWSPDGLNLAFATKDHDTPIDAPLRVIVLPMDPSSRSVIAERSHTLTKDIYCSGIGHNSGLMAWASNPERIYFATCPNPNEASDIVEVINSEGDYGATRKMTEGKVPDKPFKLYPDVSADSSQLVYVAAPLDFSFADIYVQDISLQSEPRALLKTWMPPDWPKDSKVRFIRYPLWQLPEK